MCLDHACFHVGVYSGLIKSNWIDWSLWFVGTLWTCTDVFFWEIHIFWLFSLSPLLSSPLLSSPQVLKGSKKLCLSVRSVGRIPGGYVTNHVYTWVDPQGRSVSPPPDLPEHRSATLRRTDSQRRSNMQLLQEGDEKKVRIYKGNKTLRYQKNGPVFPLYFFKKYTNLSCTFKSIYK